MRAPHLATGDWGEDLAADWYRTHGYEVLDRNWRCAAGEIDLGGGARPTGRDRRSEDPSQRQVRAGRVSGPSGQAAPHPRFAVEWLRAREVHGVQLRFDVVAITGTDLAHHPRRF